MADIVPGQIWFNVHQRRYVRVLHVLTERVGVETVLADPRSGYWFWKAGTRYSQLRKAAFDGYRLHQDIGQPSPAAPSPMRG